MTEQNLGVGSKFKIMTWNMNGIRSFEDFQDRLNDFDADIICIQETKVTRDMLTEVMALVPGFTSYYAFSRVRSGYSGVATYCRFRVTPTDSESSLINGSGSLAAGVSCLESEFSTEELRSLDKEGRCVITRHQVMSDTGSSRHVVIINVYCPRADPEKPERGRYKQLFYKALDIRANFMRKAGDHVIVCGDVNTSHKEIDHCDPYEEFEDNPGRRFLSHFLQDYTNNDTKTQSNEDEIDDWVTDKIEMENNQFVDSFRVFHPNRQLAFTCWNTKMNCRSTNYGTRIDYIFSSFDLVPHLQDCDIHPEVQGSDHCPVTAIYNLNPLASDKPPEQCTKYFKEFSGKQVKLSNFFIKTDRTQQLSKNSDSCPVPLKKAKPDPKNKITSFFTSKDSVKTNKVNFETKPQVLTQPPMNTKQTDKTEQYNNNAKVAWGSIFKPPPPAPLCTKHKEEAVKRKVTKKGANTGREFWCCRRGEGRADDVEARCDFFKWVK